MIHDTHPQMKIRLPPQVKAWLEKTAKTNRRSQNGEIIYRLEAAMAADAGTPAAKGSLENPP